MKRLLTLASLALAVALLCPADARAQRGQYEELVARHAQANGVPVTLVHRVIMRESRYNAALVGRGGTIGLMQIKLATARSLGYGGSAEGLRDPDYDEAATSAYMKEQNIVIRVNLNLGQAAATVWTCDLTKEYIEINGDYRS